MQTGDHPDPWTYPSVIYGIYGTYIIKEYMENYGKSTVIDFFQVIPHGSSIALCSFTHFTHGPCAFIFWLVVSTLLKNISQVGLLFPIYEYGKIKNVPDHQPVYIYIYVHIYIYIRICIYIYSYDYDHSAVQSPEMLGDSGMVCSTCHHHIETSDLNLLTDDDSWMFVLFCTIMGFHGNILEKWD